MNTKILMTVSAVLLAIMGIALTFFPAELGAFFNISSTNSTLFILQIGGALYFAFAMLNWMAKGAIIGGIYNRPIAIGNFTHFTMVAIASVKYLFNQPLMPISFWIFTVIYCILAISFAITVFNHPAEKAAI
ncbi:MAG: hypothetical protein ABI390_01630 [Daejeonella sp.]